MRISVIIGKKELAHMVYKALYRTYRPQKFFEVIGQDHIVRTLQNSIINNKISHAYLFSGPRGTGKTSVARIFAKALNCANPKNMEPCGECTSCEEISLSINPDVVEIDAASNNGVDEIREIRDKVKFLPGGAKYKIYIIDEVHMLSQGAFNALLKTLEEPPKHVIFILATTEPHKVIPTILSRCQRFDFKTLNVQEIASLIKSVSLKEGFEISDEAIIAISEGAEGGMRDALSFLDQAASFTDSAITIDDVNSVTGNLNFDKIVELAKYFEEKNINKALKTINDLVIMGKEINKIVSSLLQFYRDCLLYKSIDVSMFSKYIFEKEDFKVLATKINVDKIFYYIDVLSEVQVKIKMASTPTIYLEVATIKMINSNDHDFSYNKRIKELEEKLNNLEINPSSGGIENNEKINNLENRLNKVINELSRLELHKLSERIDNFEKAKPEINYDYSNIERELNLLKQYYVNLENKLHEVNGISDIDESSINFLKQDIDKLRMELNNLNNEGILSNYKSNDEVDDKLQKLQNLILNMQSDFLELRNSKVNNQPLNIEEIKNDLSLILSNKLSSLELELNSLKKNKDSQEGLIAADLKYEIEKIQEKLNNIESKVYKLMSKELEKKETKKIKINENRKQIVLFGDEIMNLNEFSKQSQETKDEEENTQEEITQEEITQEEMPKVGTQLLNDEITSSMFTIEKKDHYETKEQKPIAENTIIKTIKTDNEEIVERQHSQLVRKISNQEIEDPDKKQEENIASQVKAVAEKQEEKTEEKYALPEDLANDEYSNYNVKVLERILHDSRSEAAREDKIRLMNLWKGLDRSVPKAQMHIAVLLQDGKLVATGVKEFVLIYPNAALCNQVMRYSFKKESLKILYDFLNDTYNYFAIPENIWIEKRTEYINQYNIGIRFPKLTPIADRSLNVLDENLEYLKKQETSRSKAISFFGEELVKID